MTRNYYWICLAAITLFAAGLRFWHLGELNFLVFDEVYFPKYAYDFLTDQYYFDVHPPLSKYLIGIGITIYNHLPWVNDPAIGTVPIDQLNAISWRWLNAVTGTAFVFLGSLLACFLTKSRLFALIVALFFAIDGSLIVESRFGMNNIYILFFGIGAFICLAYAIVMQKNHRRMLVICGILLGLTYSVKWNGLGYSLAVWGLTFGGSLCVLLVRNNLLKVKNVSPDSVVAKTSLFRVVELWEFPIYLMAIPFAVYVMVWQPHLNKYENFGFFGMQKQILGYHSKSVTADEHPYCSKWYTWPLMKRPVGFYFKSDVVKGIEGIEGTEAETKIFTDVHLFGNPVLYILSFLSVLYLSVVWVFSLWGWYKRGVLPKDFAVTSFITIGFFANWLPWMIVSRCLFLYHYLPAATISFVGLAWVITKLINKAENWSRALAISTMILIVLAFIYWLPFQMGIKIPASSFYDRMWFQSWI